MSKFTAMGTPPSVISRSPDAAAEQRAMEHGFVAREGWAFEASYRAYCGVLYGAAYAVLRNAGEAEDCVHDVLLRLWREGHAYTPARGSLRAFLAVCVRNEALTRRRKQRNRARIELKLLPDAAGQSAESSEERIDMANLLASLNTAQRQLLDLAYYQGLTHEEIARRLDEPLGTVKSRLSNSLRGLRRILSGGPQ